MKEKSLLLQAAEAAKLVTKARGYLQQTHCVLEGGMCKATDGDISIGHPCGTDLAFVPQVTQLVELAKQLNEATLTLQDGQLVASQGDRAIMIAGADRSKIDSGFADAQVAPATDRLKDAFNVALKICEAKCADLRGRFAFSTGGTLTATDGKTGLEFHHGVDLPSGIPFSVQFMTAVTKIKSPIVGFGYSGITATVWFENGAYVRGKVPQISAVDLSKHFADWPTDWLDAGQFFECIKAIEPFGSDGFFIIEGETIRSYGGTSESRILKFDSCGIYIPDAERYSSEGLLALSKHGTHIAFGQQTGNVYVTDRKSWRAVTKALVKPDDKLYVEPHDEIPY